MLTSALLVNLTHSGTPEAPSQVHAECGTHSGDILVTWSPITLENNGLSNGLTVAGYRLYVNSICLKEVPGPTGEILKLN